MDKPKINLRAWEPIEKRKKNSLSNITGPKEKDNGIIENFNYEKKSKYWASVEEKNLSDNNFALNYTPQSNDEKYYDSHANDKDYDPRYFEYKFDENTYSRPKLTSRIFNNFNHNSKKPRKKYINRRGKLSINPNLIRSLGAGIGAILTGMIFGYLLLSYFVNPMFNEGDNTTVNNTANQGNTNITNEAVINNVKSVPSQSFYLIQAGVFTERNGAETIFSEQKQIGKSAFIAGEGPYYVFVGMANNKDDAIKLKETFAQEDELYVKEFTLPEYQVNMNNESFNAFYNLLETGDNLVFYLTEGSVNALTDPAYSINYEEIQKEHQQFLNLVQEIKPLLNEEELSKEKKTVDNLAEDISYAITALNAYKKNLNPQYLWSIQDILIKYKMELVKMTAI